METAAPKLEPGRGMCTRNEQCLYFFFLNIFLVALILSVVIHVYYLYYSYIFSLFNAFYLFCVFLF